MPDPKRQTISATEIPALFGESPYLTRFMLYQRIANGVDLSIEEDERMREGRRMQPLVLERAAEELKLDISGNADNIYVRNGPLGCTRDAVVYHPEKGPGALETKCVFDYAVWMKKWNGGDFVPREYELQLAAQMAVGDGRVPFSWGIIAVWVGAHQYYFERTPNEQLISAMRCEAQSFLADVAARKEPDPLGVPLELPLIAELYPTVEGSTLDMREHETGDEYVRKIRVGMESKETATTHKGVYDAARAEFVALMKGHESLLLPGNVIVRFRKGRLSWWSPNGGGE